MLFPFITMLTGQECDFGFVWIEDVHSCCGAPAEHCFFESDLNILQQMIDNSSESINMLHDDNENGELEAFAGDSYILFVSWDKNGKVSSKSVHQYGSANTKEGSPHYSDQSFLFANRQLKDVWFEEEEIINNLEDSYKPGERYAK